MMIPLRATVIAVVLGLGSAALADGPVTPDIAVPNIPEDRTGDWGGFYAGVSVGYGDLDTNLDNLTQRDTGLGAHVGYDVDLGRTIIGAALERSHLGVALGDQVEVTSITRLKFRAGQDLGNTLIYAAAGAAQVRTSLGQEAGILAGLGVAHQAHDNLVLGGELLHQRFDNIEDSNADIDATTLTFTLSYRF